MEAEMLQTDSQSRFDLLKMRNIIRSYTDKHQLDSALFWADKLVTLSKGEQRDVYCYSNVLYLTGQYHRALNQLKTHRLHQFPMGRYLAARCYFAIKDYQEALSVLDQTDAAAQGSVKNKPGAAAAAAAADVERHIPGVPSENVDSAIQLLRGHIYEALDNRSLAVDCYRDALLLDARCYEAFDCLVQHHMMTAAEEKQLLESLPLNTQCSADEAELLKFCYENILKKYNRPGELVPSHLAEVLSDNGDVRVAVAERHYYNCDFQRCYNASSQLLKDDPYNLRCLPLHIAVLVELRKLNELFYLAHKLIDIYPSSAVSWFAVGCYYFASGKQEPARRYLSKSTALNRVFGPAWLAYGHSFAAENEHDQAMAAYFTASQLMKGCHLPLLYVGLEYGLTNNSKLAERFFNQAHEIAPDDPFVLHEIGVTAFQSQEYEKAEHYFLMTVSKMRCLGNGQEITTEKWEPLLNNLGHVCRKLRKYKEALEYHRQSLVLRPHSPSTLSAMGYAHALNGDYAQAVDCFHKALGLRRDDTFSTTMLNSSIEQLINDMPPCADLPSTVPEFRFHGLLDSGASTSRAGSDLRDMSSVNRTWSDDPTGTSGEDNLARNDEASMLDVEMDDA